MIVEPQIPDGHAVPRKYHHKFTDLVCVFGLDLKKNTVCFRFPTDPNKTRAT